MPKIDINSYRTGNLYHEICRKTSDIMVWNDNNQT